MAGRKTTPRALASQIREWSQRREEQLALLTATTDDREAFEAANAVNLAAQIIAWMTAEREAKLGMPQDQAQALLVSTETALRVPTREEPPTPEPVITQTDVDHFTALTANAKRGHGCWANPTCCDPEWLLANMTIEEAQAIPSPFE